MMALVAPRGGGFAADSYAGSRITRCAARTRSGMTAVGGARSGMGGK